LVNTNKSILITGATGFIGKHLVRALTEKGLHCRCLIRNKNSAGELMKLKSIDFTYADITDKDSVMKHFHDVEIVFHLAAQLGKHGIHERNFRAVNIDGTRNLLEEAYNANVRQFIFCSTPGVQGKGHTQAPETLTYNPPYVYEKTKAEAEKLVITFCNNRNIAFTVIRPDFVYGPGDMRRLSLYRAIKKHRFLIVGNGQTFVHPTYIDDVVQGFILALSNPVAFNEIFNIAGPRQITVEEYVTTIARLLDVRIPRFKIPKKIAISAALACEALSKVNKRNPFISRSKIEFLTVDHSSDISKAKNRLGYYPEYEFECGMRNTIEWYFNHGLL